MRENLAILNPAILKLTGIPLLVANLAIYLSSGAALILYGGSPDLVAFAVAVLYASLLEYLMHRFLFHAKFETPAKLHRLHHDLFPARAMAFRTRQEWSKILFSPATTALIVFVAAVHCTFLMRLGFDSSGAAIACGLISYFCLYDLLHLAFHSRSSILRLFWPLRWLRHQHLKHHSIRYFSTGNYNVVIPVIDFSARLLKSLLK